MRTTLVIDDQVLRKAKAAAVRRGITLSELVTQALRGVLAARPISAGRFQMGTYGSAEKKIHHEPEDLARALEDDDRESLVR